MLISIDRRQNIDPVQLKAMHKLRARVFSERKGWDVSVIAEMEIDGYDALDPYYMIMYNSADGELMHGCWRILPTTGPNMLANTFPELLNGKEAPCGQNIWELSRFAIASTENSNFKFSELSVTAIRTIVEFAVENGVEQFVTVTTVGVEKLLRRQGLDISRMGPSIRIGVEHTVALSIELNSKTRSALSKHR